MSSCMRHGLEVEERIEPDLLDLAYAHGVPLVATNDIHFMDASFYEAHDVLLCIAQGAPLAQEDRRRLTVEHRFKSPAEMAELFADLPEALDNTLVVARRCAFKAPTREPILPTFAEDEEALMRRLAAEGLERRLQRVVWTEAMGEAERESTAGPYRERLAYELDVIAQMNFSGYFLIVSDFITWAKGRGIPVGPGRGSGAGSVVAWSLEITDLDPLRFGLLFERFLNPERVSMPDFDIDFCEDRRGEVIAYVRDRYGADRVAQIITFGTLQARAALRDVGRVLGLPFGLVDRVCKVVPNNPAHPVTLAQALEMEPRLRQAMDEDEGVARMVGIAMKLEGLPRNASTHAAGVVIGDRPLDELVPLYRDPRAPMPATQFNMKDVEKAGLVKLDFLGLSTLTLLRQAEEMIRARGVSLDLAKLPLDDRPTYELVSRAETTGIFQLESGGMRDALRKLKPDCLEDIVAMNALYRPGPMDNIPRYINVKHGVEDPSYLHPMLKPILEETNGVIIFQEQVMEIAKQLAGYTLGGADLLRRAMGKKIKSEMDAQRETFIAGATSRGIEEGSGGHHLRGGRQVRLLRLRQEPRHRLCAPGLPDRLPQGQPRGRVLCGGDDHRNGLAGEGGGLPPGDGRPGPRPPAARHQPLPGPLRRRGHGQGPGGALCPGRHQGRRRPGHGAARRRAAAGRPVRRPFRSRRAGRPQGAQPAHAGGTGQGRRPRRARRQSAPVARGHRDGAAPWPRRGRGGGERPGQPLRRERPRLRPPRPPLPSVEDWPILERLQNELEAIGFYMSAHPLDGYRTALQRMGVVASADLPAHLAAGGRSRVTLAGVVIGKQERATERARFAFVQLSDATGQYEVALFSDLLSQVRELLEGHALLLVDVDARLDGEAMKLTAQHVEPLERRVERQAAGTVEIRLRDLDTAQRLRPLLAAERGARVRLVVELPAGERLVVALPEAFTLAYARRADLGRLPGVVEVREVTVH